MERLLSFSCAGTANATIPIANSGLSLTTLSSRFVKSAGVQSFSLKERKHGAVHLRPLGRKPAECVAS